MIFNSYIFTLCFLPVTVLIYFILNRVQKYSLSKFWLIAISLFFVGFGDRYAVTFLVSGALITWILGIPLRKCDHGSIVSKVFLGVGVGVQIAVLGYFKYAYFLVQNVNRYLHASFSLREILLPAGISFITFQQIAFLVDLYRGKISRVSLVDYLFYISYFPKLVQGPITKYEDLVPQMNDPENRKANMDNLAYGLWLFATGLARKVLLADVLSKAVSWGYELPVANLTAMEALVVSLCFTFQIYFDFSGYSHMALGISKMLNLTLPDNFDSPYQAVSVIEFWKRWHISLTSFLREYLYFPLGGSRKGTVRTYLNTMIVFLVSGLWHGAAWNYVFWGGLHGIGQCLNKAFERQWEKLHVVIRWFVTFSFVNMAWIFFRAESVSHAWEMIQKIIKMEDLTIGGSLLACFELSEVTFLKDRFPVIGEFLGQYPVFGLIVFLLIVFLLCFHVRDKVTTFRPGIAKCILTILLFSWSVVSFSTVVEFIYGGF